MNHDRMSLLDLVSDYEETEELFEQFDKNIEACLDNKFDGIEYGDVMNLMKGYRTLIETVLSNTDINRVTRGINW